MMASRNDLFYFVSHLWCPEGNEGTQYTFSICPIAFYTFPFFFSNPIFLYFEPLMFLIMDCARLTFYHERNCEHIENIIHLEHCIVLSDQDRTAAYFRGRQRLANTCVDNDLQQTENGQE
jgi:hypothetical protein